MFAVPVTSVRRGDGLSANTEALMAEALRQAGAGLATGGGGSVRELLERYPASAEHMLDMLHDLQDAEPRNYLKLEALLAVADYLSIPLSRVMSVATFYSMYSLEPRGRHIIRLCESPPCQLVGSETMLDVLREYLGVHVGGTTEDGAFTLETASCLGVCDVAPAMMLDAEIHGNLTKELAINAIEAVRGNDA